MDKRLLENLGQSRTGLGRRFFVFFLAGVLVSGCASVRGDRAAAHVSDDRDPSPTVVSYSDYRDPLIRINRGIFKFNDVTYRCLLIPLSKGYTRFVPDPVERCIGNFFFNIKTPIYAVNHLLQGKPKPMTRTLLRFGINTTMGLLGFFDPAKSKFKIKREETYFENTLAHYSVDYGIYLVIPILGPSDLRRGAGTIADSFLNPVTYLTKFPWSTAIQGFDSFQNFAPVAKRYTLLRRKSEDPYIFFRNLYLQGVQRDADY